MSFEVRSCREYFAEDAALCFLPDLKTQTQIISIGRCSLAIAEYGTHGKTRKGLGCANGFLGDVKTVLNCARIPHIVVSWHHKRQKLLHSYRALYARHQNGERFSARDWVLNGTLTASFLHATLSIVGHGIYKPIKMTYALADLGKMNEGMYRTWAVLSMLKSSAKIAKTSGQLHLTHRHIGKRVAIIALEIGKFVHTILVFNKIYIHPAASIALSLARSIYGLIDICARML